MKIKTWDITGFSGGYEATCQKMLWNGVRFLSLNGHKPEFKAFENVYGLCWAENEDGKQLEKAIMKDVKDATGAMHQCAIGHILYIHKNGYDKWFQELKKSREPKEESVYECEDFELN